MYYILRYADGKIQSVSKEPQPGGESLDDNDPELQHFFEFGVNSPAFDSVDADFVRVLEDVIDTLIAKNVIRHTDLPAVAQKKLMMRKGLRNRVHGALNILGSGEDIL